MGKRSNFERKPRDFYPTPFEAVEPLIPHLEQMVYMEPCAGDGRLIAHLSHYGVTCTWASDIEPKADYIHQKDVQDLDFCTSQFITNPPWQRDLLHSIIDHLRQLGDTWLLFDADWSHSVQCRPYIKYCHKIISVGRLSWMENGVDGKDNCAWHLFRKPASPHGYPLHIMERIDKRDKRCRNTNDMFEENA